MGRGEEEPSTTVVCDPGSKLRLGRGENRRAKIMNEIICEAQWSPVLVYFRRTYTLVPVIRAIILPEVYTYHSYGEMQRLQV